MHVRNLISAFALVLNLQAAFGQQPEEVFLDFNNRPDGDGNLFKTQFGNLLFTGLATIPQGNLSLLVRGIDSNNNLQFIKPIEPTNLSWGRIGGKFSVESPNGGYYVVLNETNSFNEELWCPVLIRVNSLGDTIWSKRILNEEPGKFYNYTICFNGDNNIYLAGQYDENLEDPIDPIKLSVIKTDSLGNVNWHNTYFNGNNLAPITILATALHFYVGGIVYDDNNQAFGISKQFIRKFDLDGNSIWYKKIHVPPVGAEAPAVALIEREDGNIVYAGGRSLGVLPGTGEENNPYTAPCAGVINAATGNVIFENTYNENARYQQFYNLKKLSTGGYIGVGTHRYVSTGELAGNPIGFMVKLDEDLNQIWYRYYVPSVWEGFSRWNNLTDVVENDNGTFTAIGLIYTYTGDGPQGPGDGGFIQDTYLITVDQEGCIIPDCYLGFTEVDQLEEFSVYPNPANNQVNIRWNKVENTEVIVHNSTGQIVLKKSVNQQNQVGLDVSMLPAGVYTVRCIIGGGVSSKVFVKE